MKVVFRRLRGALGNAVVWGVGWFLAGCALIAGFMFLEPNRAVPAWQLVRAIFRGALGIGLAGAAVGGLFSAFVAANFRSKRLQDLSVARFALGGGLVTVLVVVAVTYGFSLFSGWPFLLQDLVRPVLTLGSMGAITALGSIKIAQRGLPPSETLRQLEGDPEGTAPLPE